MKRTTAATVIALTSSLALLAGCGAMDSAAMSGDTSGGGPGPASPMPSETASPSEPSPDTSKPQETGAGLQAGTLTAGSFDDHLNPAVFDAFINGLGGQIEGVEGVARRALIRVRNTNGDPVGEAQVVVEAGGRQLVSLRTGTDGRALYLPARDGGGDAGPFSLSVELPGGAMHSEQDLTLDKAPWEVTVDGAVATPPTQLDVALVIDATGSMGDELHYLKVETTYIAEQIATRHPNVDVRYALVVYRDSGDEYVTRAFDFAGLDAFRDDLARQGAAGGGDYPEAMHEALAQTAQLSWRSDNTARVVFLIGDAPPHAARIGTTLDTINSLRRAGVRVYPVAASGVGKTAELVMRVGAFMTLGRYLFLTDDSGVGNPHAEPHIPCYEVEKLSHLMVRMIASELAGQLLPPAAADVIRTVGQPDGGVCLAAEQQQPAQQ